MDTDVDDPKLKKPGYLYIEEHIDVKETSFEEVAEKMGVSRVTVWRWSKEQWRLDPQKIVNLAKAIGLESWQDLAREPGRVSVDGILENADQDTLDAVAALARSLTKRHH